MANKIICIAREFGSGGHEIAVRTASKLGIRVYEKDLFHLACKYGELSEKMMESADETATNPYLFRTVHEGNYHVTRGLPTSEVLFQLQSHEIRKIAQQENCIFVGRCADYALANYPHLVNVFIYADIKKRAARVAEYEGIPLKEAEERALKTDKKRASYYNFYSNNKWGAVESYHLSVDSGAINLDNTARLILDFAQMKDPV